MRRVFEVLAPLGDADVKRVYAISKINHHRLESWARWMAVGFITLPVSVVLTLKEIDPELFNRVRERLDTATFAMLGVTAIAVLYQIVSAWRALRIATAVDFVMVERGLIEDWQAG